MSRKSKKYSKNKKKITKKRKIKKIKGGNNIKILIYCHPHIIRLDPNESYGQKFKFDRDGNTIIYYLSNQLENIFDKNNWSYDNVSIDTIDIINGGTFMDDSFSDEFISQHQNEYDIVFVPDCAGKWMELQDQSFFNIVQSNIERFNKYLNDKDAVHTLSENNKKIYEDYIKKYTTYPPVQENIEQFCLLIQKIGTQLKSNGVLYCSKFKDKTLQYMNEHIESFLTDFNISLLNIPEAFGFTLYAIKK